MEKKTLLLVDDAPENLDLLVGLLKDRYRLKAATSGELALRLVRASLPDLILLDIVMPGMDGFELCRVLKADQATAAVPIIFLSGSLGEDERTRAMDLGGCDCLEKPVDPAHLLQTLEVYLPSA